jgi:hypothetical protein
MKQIKTLKTKKTAALAATKAKKVKQLDEATLKEVRYWPCCVTRCSHVDEMFWKYHVNASGYGVAGAAERVQPRSPFRAQRAGFCAARGPHECRHHQPDPGNLTHEVRTVFDA